MCGGVWVGGVGKGLECEYRGWVCRDGVEGVRGLRIGVLFLWL